MHHIKELPIDAWEVIAGFNSNIALASVSKSLRELTHFSFLSLAEAYKRNYYLQEAALKAHAFYPKKESSALFVRAVYMEIMEKRKGKDKVAPMSDPLNTSRLSAMAEFTWSENLIMSFNRLGVSTVATPNFQELSEASCKKKAHEIRRCIETYPIPLRSISLLDIHSLDLTVLPPEVGLLSQLKELRIGYNKLTTLPETLGNLEQLELLYMQDNQLSFLPNSMGNLKQLKILYAGGNRLLALPDTLSSMSRLETLYISDNQLSALPNNFGNFAQLKWLDLSKNCLSELPETMSQLGQLQELVLDTNRFTHLPEFIGVFRRLRWFNVSYNQLTSLPSTMTNLESLEMLNIMNNKLTVSPEFISHFARLHWAYVSNSYFLK